MDMKRDVRNSDRVPCLSVVILALLLDLVSDELVLHSSPKSGHSTWLLCLSRLLLVDGSEIIHLNDPMTSNVEKCATSFVIKVKAIAVYHSKKDR